jgi:hypothetical protein
MPVTTRLAAALTAASSVLFLSLPPAADAAPVVSGSSVGTAAPGVVYRGDQLLPFLQAMQTRRVDVAGIGDSNQILGGTYGHDHGQQKAWADRVGLYGTGIIPVNAFGSFQGAMGYNYGGGLGGVGRPQTDAPAALQPYLLPANVGFPGPALVLSQGDTVSASGSQVALEIPANSPWGVTPAFRWHVTYGTTAGGPAGTFSPSARLAATTNILATRTVSTAAGPAGLADTSIDVAADPARTGAIWFEPTKLFEQSAAGPLVLTDSRVEVPAKSNGVAYSTLLYQGGQTTRDAAVSLQQASDTSLGEWMRQATKLQNVPKSQQRLMVQVIQGANDLSDATLSVGPNPAPTKTPAGYRDNLAAVNARLRAAWIAAGYDPANLNLVIGAYHPNGTTPAEAATLEQAAMQFADGTTGVTVLRGTKMLSGSTLLANGWYRDAGGGVVDKAHLSQAGYEAVGRLTVNQMLSILSDGSPARSTVSSLSVVLTEDPTAALRPDQLTLVATAGGATVAATDTSVDYDAATRTATWTFPGLDGDVLARGQYQATIAIPGLSTPYAFSFAAVPEPASVALSAVAGLVCLSRRRRRPAAGRCVRG